MSSFRLDPVLAAVPPSTGGATTVDNRGPGGATDRGRLQDTGARDALGARSRRSGRPDRLHCPVRL